MTITKNGYYDFHTCTRDEYKTANNANRIIDNDFYFISDDKVFYIGKDLYNGVVEVVENDFPTKPAPKRLYIKTSTLEVKFSDDLSNYITFSAGIVNTLNEDTDIGKLVTAGAIKTYITSQIGSSSLINNVTYSNDGNFTFTYTDGTTKVVNTPAENFLQNAVYNSDTHILTLTMQSGNNLDINLNSLIDTYTGGDTTTISSIITNNVFTSTVKLSTTEGNNLSTKTDGLYSATTWKAI